MGKRIIVTAGPTNERIDAVMKITNMSTGSLGTQVVETMLEQVGEQIDKIYYVSSLLARKPSGASGKVEFLSVESTADLLGVLTELLQREHIDLVVHSAAVGDYKGKYVIRAEDLIDEIVARQAADGPLDREQLLSIFEQPRAVQNDATKISSYEPHLMTMLALTPKVIGSIKTLSPATHLVGFKLLEGVSREELFQVADRLREKNQADYIVANDLSRIGEGKHWAMFVGKDGVAAECETNEDIARAIVRLMF